MFTICLRAIIIYIICVIAMRIMGKRQVGQLQPYELVLAIMIADVATSPLEGVNTPLGYGIVPLLALVFIHSLSVLVTMKSGWFRKVVGDSPSVIISNGVVSYKEMKKMNYSMSDLLEQLRAQGFLNISQVCTAVLETSGTLTAFPFSSNRPLTPLDMRMDVAYEGIPATLTLDGKSQPNHLKRCDLDEKWLKQQLDDIGIVNFDDVAICSLDSSGLLFVQEKKNDKNAHRVQAINKQ